jgi:hypothetical protein
VASSLNVPECLRIETCDPRSDDRRRVVDVARGSVVIRRVVAGVPMAIRVASAAYRGVALRISGFDDGRFHYEVKLLHRDPDLAVLLAEGGDEAAIAAQWREWVKFLGLPALVGRTELSDVQVNIDGVDLARRLPSPRRRGSAAARRRPRFLMRRKVGRPLCGAVLCPASCVLFDGSKLDR